MTTPRANKKRRIETAQSVLHKPFRSPLRVGREPKSNTLESSSLKQGEAVDGNDAAGSRDELGLFENIISSGSLPESSHESPPKPSARPIPHRPLNSFSQRSHANAFRPKHPNNPTLVALETEIFDLESQQRTLQAETETLTNGLAFAKELQSDDPNALPNQTRKWREIAQRAAEEWFQVVKERVDGMGGVRVWREEERQRGIRLREWQEQGFGDDRAGGEEEVEAVEGLGVEEAEVELSGQREVGRMGDQWLEKNMGRGDKDDEDDDVSSLHLPTWCSFSFHRLYGSAL
jgi:Swi5-dependent recombination DNA repair protein 1